MKKNTLNYISPRVVILACIGAQSALFPVAQPTFLPSQFEVLSLQQDQILTELREIRELLHQQKELKEDRSERDEYQELLDSMPSERTLSEEVSAMAAAPDSAVEDMHRLMMGSDGSAYTQAFLPERPQGDLAQEMARDDVDANIPPRTHPTSGDMTRTAASVPPARPTTPSSTAPSPAPTLAPRPTSSAVNGETAPAAPRSQGTTKDLLASFYNEESTPAT